MTGLPWGYGAKPKDQTNSERLPLAFLVAMNSRAMGRGVCPLASPSSASTKREAKDNRVLLPPHAPALQRAPTGPNNPFLIPPLCIFPTPGLPIICSCLIGSPGPQQLRVRCSRSSGQATGLALSNPPNSLTANIAQRRLGPGIKI